MKRLQQGWLLSCARMPQFNTNHPQPVTAWATMNQPPPRLTIENIRGVRGGVMQKQLLHLKSRANTWTRGDAGNLDFWFTSATKSVRRNCSVYPRMSTRLYGVRRTRACIPAAPVQKLSETLMAVLLWILRQVHDTDRERKGRSRPMLVVTEGLRSCFARYL